MDCFFSSLDRRVLKDRRLMVLSLLLGMGTVAVAGMGTAAAADGELPFSFTTVHPLRLQDLIAALFAAAMFLVVFALPKNTRETALCAVFAAVFAVCQWIGAVYSYSETWDPFLCSKGKILKGIVYIGAWLCLAFAAVRLLTALLRLLPVFAPGEIRMGGAGRASGHAAKGLRARFAALPLFVRAMLLLMLCWLPYYIVFWPGVIHDDFFTQILQLLHLPTRFQGRQITDGAAILFSNDHPFLYTQLVGLFLRPAINFGKPLIGIGIYTFLQMTGCAAAFSWFYATLCEFGGARGVLRAIFLVWAFFPTYPMFSILIGGDAFFSIVFVLFVTVLVRIFCTRGKDLEHLPFLLAGVLIIFLLSAAKNQGVYIAAVTFPVVLIAGRRHWKQILLLFLAPLLFYQFIYTGVIFDRCGVAPVGRQEGLSFFFQQTARYLKYNGDDVLPEEKEAISRIFPYDELADRYEPGLSDPVKSTLPPDVSDKDMQAYFRAWASMGRRHPDTYLQAFLANTWGYYIFDFGEYKGSMYFTLSNLETYQKNRPWAKRLIEDGTISPELQKALSWQPPKALRGIRGKAKAALEMTRNIPLLNLSQPPGVVFWLTLLCLLLFLLRRDWHFLWAFFPAFLVFGVCLLSPKNSSVRYSLPDCMLLPGLIGTCAGHVRRVPENDTGRNEAEMPAAGEVRPGKTPLDYKK